MKTGQLSALRRLITAMGSKDLRMPAFVAKEEPKAPASISFRQPFASEKVWGFGFLRHLMTIIMITIIIIIILASRV